MCGEGGEYETLTLDCPLFHVSSLVLLYVMVTPGSLQCIHMLYNFLHRMRELL